MNKPIIWIHGDCLNPKNPVFQKYPHAPAIWVWDDALIEEWQLSLKRLTFIYECLLELPVEIRRGNVGQEILNFAQEHDANLVVTVDSPSPHFQEICHQVKKHLNLEVFAIEAFFDYDGFIDLKRFSRYWKVAGKYMFD
ncbi:hypothetical protein VB713_17405 [Anabaena cylindrica UHCC 0172]|uniref:hypothetical protein n=1 Tax=Anabaena cylindrica TaxID=1165 RepID=UPI002B1FA8EF|nr:hypothetical protein [Anabaena cylindrica]MEA5552723.1 hypothetical protein [Anabaena cylindrica UHCC 0172]